MNLKAEIKKALVNMDFLSKYERFMKQFKYINIDESFENYDNQEIIKVINKLGYDAKYDKRENFFKVGVLDKSPLYQVWFNLSLKVGIFEPIWVVYYKGKVRLGSPWGRYIDDLEELEGKKIEYIGLSFRNYEELEEILKIAFQMYEDFKIEIDKIYSNEEIDMEEDAD